MLASLTNTVSKTELLLYKLLFGLRNSLEERYTKAIDNRLVWVIVLIAVVGILGYAFYCTSKGYSFSGDVKLNWPKVWEVGIGCRP